MAAAVMALINPLIGFEPVSWNVFLAGIIGMLMNLDAGDARISKGSPIGHSLGFGIIMVYLAGMIAYFGYAFGGFDFTGMVIVLALGVGIFTHLATEYITGEQIFTIPNNMRPERWLRKMDASSDRFWSSWNRLSLKGKHLKDSQVNTISLALIIIAIGLF